MFAIHLKPILHIQLKQEWWGGGVWGWRCGVATKKEKKKKQASQYWLISEPLQLPACAEDHVKVSIILAHFMGQRSVFSQNKLMG